MFKQIWISLFQKNNLTTVYNNVKHSCSTMASNVEAERMVWIDLEMTGLDVETCHIMEVAAIVTDGKLNIVAEGPNIIINQPPEILDTMHPWCIKQHGVTGLTEASKTSKISVENAQKTLLEFLLKYVQPGISPLAGNTVYMDRLFLKKYMPEVDNYLHYRIVDVSTVKELCRRWNPDIYDKAPKKQFLHRSLNDIKESIDELRYYREQFMKINVN